MEPERAGFAILLLATLPACGHADEPGTAPVLTGLAALRYDPAPPRGSAIASPATRPLSGSASAFFDPSLSGSLLEGDHDGSGGTLGMQGDTGKVSCASCHVPEARFVDTRSPHRQISLGAEWTTRRSPTLLEVAFAPLYNWDGRRDSLWNQAIGVFESTKEFNSGRLFVATQLFRLHRAEYEAIFGKMPPLDDASRFPSLSPAEAGCDEVRTLSGSAYACRGKPGDGADYDGLPPADQNAVTEVTVNGAKALAAYVSQLRCGPGRFDAWLDGDDAALTASEQRGATLFAGRARCTDCHSGPLLTDGQFHNVGLAPAVVAVAFTDSNDRGAADGIAAAQGDSLGTQGAFSDGDRHALPSQVTENLVGAFRTPSLRCVSTHPSFMHTGQVRSLEQAVAFHDRGGDAPGGVPGTNELTRLDLTDEERADLVAFLKTLDGEGPPEALLHTPD